MFAGSNPAKSDGFLRAIKIRSTASFGGKVKPSAPCRQVLWHVNDPFVCDRDTDKILQPFLAKYLPASLLGVSAATTAENSGG
jgi:hypothetical protein